MGKDLREEKGDLRGEKALEGKGGKGSQQKMRGKHLREEKGHISEGKRALGGKEGMDLNRGARGQFERDANKKAGLLCRRPEPEALK